MLAPRGVGLGSGWRLCYPKGLGPILYPFRNLISLLSSSPLSHPRPLPVEIPPTGLLSFPPIYLPLLLPLIPSAPLLSAASQGKLFSLSLAFSIAPAPQ